MKILYAMKFYKINPRRSLVSGVAAKAYAVRLSALIITYLSYVCNCFENFDIFLSS